MMPTAELSANSPLLESKFRQILGIRFFTGSAEEVADLMEAGGLLVVPAAPALKDLPTNLSYRDALLNADVAIPDSAFMVLLWRIRTGERIVRVSGLEYLRVFFQRPSVRLPGNTFWVMASEQSAARNLAYLKTQGIEVEPRDCYIAPFYKAEVTDPELVRRIQAGRYAHVVITVGGGKQEQLGLYLKRNLQPLPGIHCIGAAIAFLSGDQVHIPGWADRFWLGWLFRCISNPASYVPRYWSARKLAALLFRYRDRLPVAGGGS